MEYRDTWQLGTIPEEVLRSEVGRRNSLRRTTYGGGRPKVLRPCRYCELEYGYMEMRKHLRQCPQKKRSASS